MNSDSLFDTLPKQIRRQIDEAFDESMKANITPRGLVSNGSVNHCDSEMTSGAPGGFSPVTTTGGGFVIEDTEQDISDPPQEIAFSLIPSALQLLDLPPDDEEILAVFRNAASGWTSDAIHPSGSADIEGRYVSRKDWRSVCAVLLEDKVSEADEHQLESLSRFAQDEEDEDASMDDDNYNHEFSSETPDSDSEYEDEYNPTRSQRTKALRQKRCLSVSVEDLQNPTKRQRQTCLETFGLFFPDSSPEDLPKQRIMMADLQRASTLLGEKTKTEELLEMLEMFSTSPDKAMNFEDFTRMMITARLA